ncbi:MAG TPA: hypothetical protein PKI34_11180 [Bacteroidales bacterium]|nr:hypothetical protein [Bacteroidales bacterium]
MDKKIIKIASYLSIAILIIGAVFTLLIAFYGKNFDINPGLKNQLLNPYFTITLIVLLLTALAAILFPFFMLIKNPKQLLKILAVIAGVVVIALIAYAVSRNVFSAEELQKLNTTAQVSKTVGAGLIFTYIIVGITFVALIVTSLLNMFRK